MARPACLPPGPQLKPGSREGTAALSTAGSRVLGRRWGRGLRGAHLAEALPLRGLQALQQEAEFLGLRLGQALQVPHSSGYVSLLEPEQASPGAGRL